MSFMDKFSAVEIKADERISERDRDFCQRHQTAFDRSKAALQKIADILEAEEKAQKGLLAPNAEFYNPYMEIGTSGLNRSNIYEAMINGNERLINFIVHYFQRTYNVSLEEEEIKKHLLPEKPKSPSIYCVPSGYQEKMENYTRTVRDFPLRYEQIVDEIFLQLGGFSFQERAMKELLEKCWGISHCRSWQDKQIQEKFTIKNSTLSLTGYWCSCRDDSWRSQPSWEPSDDLKTVLNAVAHYETGLMECGYMLFPQLFRYDTEQNFFELTDTTKVKSVKLFKNHRVDIKFANAVTVQEFVDNYLRQNVGGV